MWLGGFVTFAAPTPGSAPVAGRAAPSRRS